MTKSVVGIVCEIKEDERRVALTPDGVAELVSRGHEVLIESGAGAGVGFDDSTYRSAGARMVAGAEVWARSDLIAKVKEPVQAEYEYLREGICLFSFLHLSAAPALTRALLDRRVTAIAYENVQVEDGSLPLLAPMSEIAGRLAPQLASRFLLATDGGCGRFISGATGAAPGRVTIIGAGMVGWNAARIAAGLGARVRLLDRSIKRLRQLEPLSNGRIELLAAHSASVDKAVRDADLIIGAVLMPGSRAPQVLSADTVADLCDGTVVCDVAIDQGGCFETSRPTTHSNPVYACDGVTHHCVANLPAAAALTATEALTAATLPYVFALADLGPIPAAVADPALRRGVVTVDGYLTSASVATEQDLEWQPSERVLECPSAR